MISAADLSHERIVRSFSIKSNTYDDFASFQTGAANILSDYLPLQVDGTILEVGAGTGLFTRHLLRRFPSNPVLITDASRAMLDVLGKKISTFQHHSMRGIYSGNQPGITSKDIRLKKYDPAGEGALGSVYPLVTSAMTAQWFQDFESGIGAMASMVGSGGTLLISSLNANSFPQWRAACNACQAKFTMNRLPDEGAAKNLLVRRGFKVAHREVSTDIRFSSAISFFKSLRETGASTQVDGIRNNSSGMRNIIRTMDRLSREQGQTDVIVTYHYDIISAVRIT
jgi:malonyl-CoA O-methyltransferase